MNPITRSLASAGAALKAFTMRWGTRTLNWTWSALGRTRYSYASSVGDGRGNAIIMACVFWLCRTFPEAPIRVRIRNGDDELEPDPRHPLVKLLHTPNPFYSGVLLWAATIADWMFGNAYWIKVRSGAGRVVELWWVPATMMEPKWPDDDSVFISHYEYTIGTEKFRIEREDVVHLRNGLDPQNPRKGLSPTGSLLREIFTDDEAANFSAALLKNLGVPGVLINPGDGVDLQPEDAEKIKAEFENRFGNDNRGRALILSAKVDARVLSFNPQQMNLKDMRRVPEERVTAILGTPAVVVGLGAGLDRSTFANFKEAREAAYESNVIPTQRLMAAEITTQLLPDFADPERAVVDFDLSQVRVLQEDQDALSKRIIEQFKSGLLTRGVALGALGYDPGEEGDVYLLPMNLVPVAAGTLLERATPREQPPQLPPPRAVVTEVPPEKTLPGVVGTKAADADDVYQRSLLRQRDRRADALEGDVTAFFKRAAREAARRYREEAAKAPAAGIETKATEDEILDVVADLKWDELDTLLRGNAQTMGESTFELVADRLGVAVVWNLENPNVVKYLDAAGDSVKGIAETTKEALRQALQEGNAAGEGIEQIAKRVRAVVEETYKNRAHAIARTETGTAQNLATILGYEESGVVEKVKVLDGDQHDDECRRANGQTWSLSKARKNPLQHPNCVRAFMPIVSEDE